MYSEFNVEWRGETLGINCMLPSPCFPRDDIAVVGVYDEDGNDIAPALWGTPDALEIHALIEEQAKTLPRWPLAILDELRELATSAPAEQLCLLAAATADTLEHGTPRSPRYALDYRNWAPTLQHEAAIVHLREAPQVAFAVINSLGVDLVERAMRLEMRCDRKNTFFGALKVTPSVLPGRLGRSAWPEIHPVVDWLLRRPEWCLITDGLNQRARRLWARRR
jgi:hypothetical protein